MKILILLLVSLGSLHAAATCADLTIEGVTDNSIRISTDCSFTGFYYYMRAKWGDTNTYSCLSAANPSTGPCIQGQDTKVNVAMGTGAKWIKTLTGLNCNTQYWFSTEISDGLSGWEGATTQATATTSACKPNYQLPTPPKVYNPPAPNAGIGGVARFVAPATHLVNGAGVPWSSLAPTTSAWYGTASFADETDLHTALLNARRSGGHADIIIVDPLTVNLVGEDFNNPVSLLRPADTYITDGTGSAAVITNYNSTTGEFTTQAAHGLSTGTYVRMSMAGGNNTPNLPHPLNPGYPYCIVDIADTTHFKVSTTCGGSVVSGGSGLAGNACFIAGGDANDIPDFPEIIIRTSVPNNLLPPNNVRIDLSYQSKLPIIRDTLTNTPTSIAFDYGCGAHHIRFLGVTFDFQSVNSAGNPDSTSYKLPFINMASDKSHIIFDRCLVLGGTNHYMYPDRTNKFLHAEGSYIAFVNSYIENLGDWTPSNLYYLPNNGGSPYSPSGTNTQTFSGGGYWRGWPVGYPGLPHPKCSNVPTITTTNAASGLIVWELNGDPSNCNNFFTATTGITFTATDSSGVTSTLSNTASPDFARTTNSTGSHYTRYPVMILTITSGNITAISPVGPADAIGDFPGNDGPGVAIYSIYGPGPISVDNSVFHNVIGEFPIHMFTGDGSGVLSNVTCLSSNIGCELLKEPGDVSVTRSVFLIDKEMQPNPVYNTVWNGQFVPNRQGAYELKEGQRIKFSGNTISGGWCNLTVLAGTSFEMGSLNIITGGFVPTSFASDIEYSYNKSDRTCGDYMQIIGYTTPVYSNVLTQRIWIHNNIFSDIDRYRYASWNSPPLPGYSGNGDGFRFANGPQHIVFNNNTVNIPIGLYPSVIVNQCRNMSSLYFSNNFLGFSTDDGKNGMSGYDCGAVPNFPAVPGDTVYGGGNAITKFWSNYTWAGNWMLGGYSNGLSLTPLTNSGLTTIEGTYSGLPGTNFINPASCDTVTCRIADIDWHDYANTTWHPMNYWLNPTSKYNASGVNHGTDGRDVGADVQQMTVAQGIVSNLAWNKAGYVTFLAPTTDTCTVDWSTDSFATFTRVTPVNSPADRDQKATLSLPSTTAIKVRTNCTGNNQIISFTTN